MRMGTLEVLLVNAEGLNNSDFLCNMDPYVIIRCRTQEQKSSVASSQGSNPEWNEPFVFTVTEGFTNLTLKIMDSDKLNKDDFIGEATIPLEGVFREGALPPTSYNVVLPDKSYCGEIKVASNSLQRNEKKHWRRSEGGRKALLAVPFKGYPQSVTSNINPSNDLMYCRI